ncbi:MULTISPECIES: NUDIX domain-containing protein [Antrihabitans]|uniref:NUDIX domain-containing protein n=2 Tax=Antrihabitans TaxID=2799491 RepID=A0A934NQY1_9NOCA|nr:NUDIX domain-containing protein [Antrihabitans stalagmiti]MBJ8339605.1 NUDIX domain-containing protein [Antrihabitans stalagmiti]
MRGDGDGWSWSSDGSRHWGKHGAAGLLLRAPLASGHPAVLLQHRAVWSHQGGTWGLPGGARDSHESTVHAAVREAEEEAGIAATMLRVRAERVTARALSGWTYTTVVADAASRLATTLNMESAELRWVPEADVHALPLHPGFAASWEELQTVPVQLQIDAEADRAALTEALPRTIELPSGGFGWLYPFDDPFAGRDSALTAVLAEHVPNGVDMAGNVIAIPTDQVLN